MSQDKKKTGVATPRFATIALSQLKDKDTAKKGTLRDLFKCVESLNSSAESLSSFSPTVVDSEEQEKVRAYLDALAKMQKGLLEMAQTRVAVPQEPEV